MSLQRLMERLGGPRGAHRRDRARGPGWAALGLVAAMAVLETGCQSGPCGSGGGILGPCGFLRRTTSRVFNRPRGGCCGGDMVGAPLESGTSSVVIPAPAYSTPGTSSSSGGDAIDMDAIPRSRIAPPSGGSQGSNVVPGKTGALSGRPTGDARLARGATAKSAAEPDPLDHLPPLDLPGEASPKAATPPPPPSVAKPTPDSQAQAGTDTKTRQADAELVSASLPPPETTVSASVGPGIARFVAVDLKLAGGSAPNNIGLSWLADKGYRTLVDLRQPSEVPAGFIGEVSRAGLRYIALPIDLASIDAKSISRFNFEIAAGEARPTFFFDSNGGRAGALWYIKRMISDKVDHPIARREAEEIGIASQSDWAAASAYVAQNGVIPRPAAPSSPSSPAKAKVENQAASDPAAASAHPRPTPAASVTPETPRATLSAITPEPPAAASESSDPGIPGEPAAWRPFAAMILTGLSLPLAYWSRAMAPALIDRARASLPAVAPRPRSLPAGSGE